MNYIANNDRDFETFRDTCDSTKLVFKNFDGKNSLAQLRMPLKDVAVIFFINFNSD